MLRRAPCILRLRFYLSLCKSDARLQMLQDHGQSSCCKQSVGKVFALDAAVTVGAAKATAVWRLNGA